MFFSQKNDQPKLSGDNATKYRISNSLLEYFSSTICRHSIRRAQEMLKEPRKDNFNPMNADPIAGDETAEGNICCNAARNLRQYIYAQSDPENVEVLSVPKDPRASEISVKLGIRYPQKIYAHLWNFENTG